MTKTDRTLNNFVEDLLLLAQGYYGARHGKLRDKLLVGLLREHFPMFNHLTPSGMHRHGGQILMTLMHCAHHTFCPDQQLVVRGGHTHSLTSVIAAVLNELEQWRPRNPQQAQAWELTKQHAFTREELLHQGARRIYGELRTRQTRLMLVGG